MNPHIAGRCSGIGRSGNLSAPHQQPPCLPKLAQQPLRRQSSRPDVVKQQAARRPIVCLSLSSSSPRLSSDGGGGGSGVDLKLRITQMIGSSSFAGMSRLSTLCISPLLGPTAGDVPDLRWAGEKEPEEGPDKETEIILAKVPTACLTHSSRMLASFERPAVLSISMLCMLSVSANNGS